MTSLIKQVGYYEDKIPSLKMDNQSVIAMARQESSSERTKHIDVRYHYLKYLVQEELIAIAFVSTEEMTADIFTKSLCQDKFDKFKAMMGMKKIAMQKEC